MTIIDTHAHIYPEKIAHKASASIGDFYAIPVKEDGTLSSLVARGGEAGISRFLIHSVAVTWERVAAINDFIAASASSKPERFIGFGAMHPEHPDMEKELNRLMALRLKGIKLHPDIQQFLSDDRNAIRLYEMMAERKLPLLMHTGDSRYPYSQPERIARALDKVPSLKIICAHLGGWSVWKEGWKILAGRGNVYVDTSSSLFALSPEAAVRVIHRFGADHVFFGTDYPVWNPAEEVARFMSLPLTEEEREKILHQNFERFMGEE